MPMAPNPNTTRTIDDARGPARQETRREERKVRPSRNESGNEGPYALDFSRIPKGFTMEWKRHSCMGQEDRHNQVVIRQNHWEPVLHKMQPHILGHLGKDEDHIVIAGLGLYMRPSYLNDDAMQEQNETTNYTLNQQLQALRMDSKNQVGERFTKIKRTVVAAQTVE